MQKTYPNLTTGPLQLKTEIIFIADQSGSMAPLKADANGSFDTFIEEQRKVPGEARLTLVKFSDATNRTFEAQDIQQPIRLNLQPSGNTALYDAIGNTLNEQRPRIEAEGWAELVIVAILTDGHENASKEFKLDTIKTMTEMAEKTGWKFIYLMSNQDAFEQAQRMGSTGQFTRTHDATSKGTRESYSYASNVARDLRTGTKT
jgi:Mg-chelatase subunit ChlD